MRLVGLRYWDADAAMSAKAVRAGSAVTFQQAGADARTDIGEKATSYRAYCGRYHLGHMPHFASTLLRAANASSTVAGNVSAVSGTGRTLEISVVIRSPIDSAPEGHTLKCAQPHGRGIYAIVNVRDMRAYIGQTTNLDRRRQEHLRQLEAGSHPKTQLQLEWQKTPSAFAFAVVDAETADLESGERYRIFIYGTADPGHGYNYGDGFAPGGGRSGGSGTSNANGSATPHVGAIQGDQSLPARWTLRSVGVFLEQHGFRLVNNRTAKGGSAWVFSTQAEFGWMADLLQSHDIAVKRYPNGRKRYAGDHYEIDPRRMLPNR